MGYIKNKVYGEPLRTMAELKTKIHQSIQIIDQETLKKVFKNMKTRLNFVIREQGRQFEHLMN